MSAVWQFVKRHKGKIAISGLAAAGAGGLYLASSYTAERREEQSQWSSVGDNALKAVRLQARKSYVFDSNQRSCDDSILDLLPKIERRIEEKFQVDEIAEKLRVSQLGQAEKVALWREMCNLAVGRLLAGAYAYTLVLVGLKTQISMLSGQIYRSSLETGNGIGIFGKLYVWLGWDEEAEAKRKADRQKNASTQQIFLQCIQYFCASGLDQLCQRLTTVATQICAGLSLKQGVSLDSLRELLSEARMAFEPTDLRNFSYYLVPLTASQDAFSGPDEENSELEQLLTNFKHVLESDSCRRVTRLGVERFFEAILDFCKSSSAELAEEGGELPLAKMVPLLANGFAVMGDREDLDAAVHELLAGAVLHQFCTDVFDNRI